MKPSPYISTLSISTLLFLADSVFAASYITANNTTPKQNSQNCSCYVVESGDNSNTPTYFQYYRFFDFRSLASGSDQYVTAPPPINDTQGNASSLNVHNQEILNSNTWNTDWAIQNWSKPATEDFPVPMSNSPANVYLGQNNDSSNAYTYLTLRTTRLKDYSTAAEIENLQKNLMHVTMRMYARVNGSKGAVAGFFTFYDDSNESDIEILTDDPTDTIRYTNQPSVDKHGNEIAKSSLAPNNLPAWDQWQTHRIDWLDKKSYWWINGNQVASNTYSVPRKASGLTINMWSDGGDWSGNMTVGSSAEFHIQWIDMAFNTSGKVDGPGSKRSLDVEERDEEGGATLEKRKKSKGCEIVCKIDGVQTQGTPEVVSVNLSAAADLKIPWAMVLVVFVVSILGI